MNSKNLRRKYNRKPDITPNGGGGVALATKTSIQKQLLLLPVGGFHFYARSRSIYHAFTWFNFIYG